MHTVVKEQLHIKESNVDWKKHHVQFRPPHGTKNFKRKFQTNYSFQPIFSFMILHGNLGLGMLRTTYKYVLPIVDLLLWLSTGVAYMGEHTIADGIEVRVDRPADPTFPLNAVRFCGAQWVEQWTTVYRDTVGYILGSFRVTGHF